MFLRIPFMATLGAHHGCAGGISKRGLAIGASARFGHSQRFVNGGTNILILYNFASTAGVCSRPAFRMPRQVFARVPSVASYGNWHNIPLFGTLDKRAMHDH